MTDEQKKPEPQPYMGTIHEASSDGFRRMLDVARQAAVDGFELIACVPLGRDGKIGSVYRNRSWKRPGAPIPADDTASPFFDEHEHARSMPEDDDG